MPEQFLAYEYSVSLTTVSRIFSNIIDVLYIRTKPFVFIERPSSLMARTQTWSSCKHHNTVKFLMGITPQGAISFISKGWGGRVTDKHITEHCGFLNYILPGDVVLADRGFDIQDIVGSQCAEVKIPAFTRGKDQLSPLEIKMTQKIANCRIHVERVIGCV